MAGRPIGKLHQEDVRRKIQASQLINVLQAHALSGESEISMSRMKAIEILLRKSVPDLSAVTIDGEMKLSWADEISKLNGTGAAGD